MDFKAHFDALKEAEKRDCLLKDLDNFEIKIKPITYDDGTTRDAACIYINGKSFLEMVREYEQKAFKNNPAACRYENLVVHKFEPPHVEMYGDRFGIDFGDENAFQAVLGDTDGESDTYPLIAEIRADENGVHWLSFHNPYAPELDYSGLGTFTFGIGQYHNELKKCNPYWAAAYDDEPELDEESLDF